MLVYLLRNLFTDQNRVKKKKERERVNGRLYRWTVKLEFCRTFGTLTRNSCWNMTYGIVADNVLKYPQGANWPRTQTTDSLWTCTVAHSLMVSLVFLVYTHVWKWIYWGDWEDASRLRLSQNCGWNPTRQRTECKRKHWIIVNFINLSKQLSLYWITNLFKTRTTCSTSSTAISTIWTSWQNQTQKYGIHPLPYSNQSIQTSMTWKLVLNFPNSKLKL